MKGEVFCLTNFTLTTIYILDGRATMNSERKKNRKNYFFVNFDAFKMLKIMSVMYAEFLYVCLVSY